MFTIPADATAKDILAAIDQWAFTPRVGCDEARALWNILTALRGPDNGDDRLKETTTAVVRRHALPCLASMSDCDVAQRGAPLPTRLAEIGEYHFAWHINRAVEALQRP